MSFHHDGLLPSPAETSKITPEQLAELKNRILGPAHFGAAVLGNALKLSSAMNNGMQSLQSVSQGGINSGQALRLDWPVRSAFSDEDYRIFFSSDFADYYGIDPSLSGFREPAPAPQRVSAAQIHAELYAQAVLPAKPAPFTEEAPTPSDRAVTLKLMGFSGHPDVKAFLSEERAYQTRKSEAIAAQDRYHWHQEILLKFPAHKFISYDALYAITDKYQLEIHGVDKFIGEIPDKNVKEMADFHKHWDGEFPPTYGFRAYLGDRFYIAAPAKEFIQTPKPQYSSVIPRWLLDDPIVLFPAYHGCVIVTAWGDEASDPDVMNERNN